MLHFIIDLTYLAIQKLLFQPLLSLKSGFKAHSNVIRFHFAMMACFFTVAHTF